MTPNTPKINPQSGAAMLGIVLVIIVILLALVGALAIGPQLQNITTERKTVKRANVIVDAVKQYYLARGELPDPSSVPVDKLNLEQEYKYDAWGQEWCYYRATIDDPDDASKRITDINGIEVDTGSGNALNVAGVLLSSGPDQEFQTTLNSSASAMTTCPDDDGSISSIIKGSDDILVPLNVQGEAIQIAKDELEVLAGKQDNVCYGIDENKYNVDNGDSDSMHQFLDYFGLGEKYGKDPWWGEDNEYNYKWNKIGGTGHWISEGPSSGSQELRSRIVNCPSISGFAGFQPAGSDGGAIYSEQTLNWLLRMILGVSDIGGSGLNKTGDTVNLGVDSSGSSSRSFTNGCLWYADDEYYQCSEIEGEFGCDFDNGFRVYFTAEFSSTGEGFTFSIINAGENNRTSCGGWSGILPYFDLATRPAGELLAYAGPGNSGDGLIFPKIGVEFDTHSNSGSGSVCFLNSRQDPPSDHVSFVFWGNDTPTCPALGNSSTWDDNRHGAEPPPGDSPSNPGPGEDTDLKGNTLHFRYEVHVDVDEDENEYIYTLKVWIHDEDDGEPEDLFKNVAGDYEDPDLQLEDIQLEDIPSEGNPEMQRIIFGFTQATGSQSQEIVLSDFKLSFR